MCGLQPRSPRLPPRARCPALRRLRGRQAAEKLLPRNCWRQRARSPERQPCCAQQWTAGGEGAQGGGHTVAGTHRSVSAPCSPKGAVGGAREGGCRLQGFGSNSKFVFDPAIAPTGAAGWGGFKGLAATPWHAAQPKHRGAARGSGAGGWHGPYMPWGGLIALKHRPGQALRARGKRGQCLSSPRLAGAEGASGLRGRGDGARGAARAKGRDSQAERSGAEEERFKRERAPPASRSGSHGLQQEARAAASARRAGHLGHGHLRARGEGAEG